MDIAETYEATIVEDIKNTGVSDMPTELIKVEQMPIISEQLEQVKRIIDNRTAEALALELTEDNRKEIKKIRAELNKEHAELDRRYKAVMDELLAPAYAVQAKYKECTEGYKKADNVLKMRISDLEDVLKNEKHETIKAYFDELAASKGIDFISFEDMGLKIRLSDSDKSLKTAVDNFLGRVSCDLTMIKTREDDADEILFEYKQNGFNVSAAINAIVSRRQRIEDERRRRIAAREEEARREQAAREAVEAAQEAIEHEESNFVDAPEALQPPTVAPAEPEADPPVSDDDKVVIVNLNLGRFKATKGKIRKLQKVIFDFIENEGGFEKI